MLLMELCKMLHGAIQISGCFDIQRETAISRTLEAAPYSIKVITAATHALGAAGLNCPAASKRELPFSF